MKHLSLKENAYQLIKEKLFSGELEPGSRIREDILAEEISMSRTPVREAINQLSAEGLVKNIPRKGIYFIEFTNREISDILDVREALETLAVVKCIEKITPEQLQRLKEIFDEFKAMLAIKNFVECNKLDSKFHKEIAVISGNSMIVGFLSKIEDVMIIARLIEKRVSPEVKNDITLNEHLQILNCISRKDVPGAIEAIKINIKRMRINLGV